MAPRTAVRIWFLLLGLVTLGMWLVLGPVPVALCYLRSLGAKTKSNQRTRFRGGLRSLGNRQLIRVSQA